MARKRSRVASRAIPNPSHSWELFAEHPDVQVGITGQSCRDAWLRSGGIDETFVPMLPRFAEAAGGRRLPRLQ
jgi:hypothetical protein